VRPRSRWTRPRTGIGTPARRTSKEHMPRPIRPVQRNTDKQPPVPLDGRTSATAAAARTPRAARHETDPPPTAGPPARCHPMSRCRWESRTVATAAGAGKAQSAGNRGLYSPPQHPYSSSSSSSSSPLSSTSPSSSLSLSAA